MIASTLHQSLISSPSTPVQNYSLNGACSNNLFDSPLLIKNQPQNQFSKSQIDRPVFSLKQNSQSSSSSGTITPSSSLKFESDLSSNPARIESTNNRNKSMPNFSQSVFDDNKKQTSQTLDKNLIIKTSYMNSLPPSTVSSSSSNSSSSSTGSASLSDDSYTPMQPNTQQTSSSASSSSNENDEICPSSSSSSTDSRTNSVDALNAEPSQASNFQGTSSKALMTQSLKNFNVKILRPTRKRFYEQRSKSLERIKYTSSYIQLSGRKSKSNPFSLDGHHDDLINQVSKRQNLYLKRNQRQFNQTVLPLLNKSVLGDLKFRSDPNITQSTSNIKKCQANKITEEQEKILDELKHGKL